MLWLIALAGIGLLLYSVKRRRLDSEGASPVGEVGMTSSQREMEEVIREITASYSMIPASYALAVCEHESGFDPSRVNRGGEYSIGLMQVNWRAHEGRCRDMGCTKPTDLHDPGMNVEVWCSIVVDLLAMVRQEFPALTSEHDRLVRVTLGLGSITTMRHPNGEAGRRIAEWITRIWARWEAQEASQGLGGAREAAEGGGEFD